MKRIEWVDTEAARQLSSAQEDPDFSEESLIEAEQEPAGFDGVRRSRLFYQSIVCLLLVSILNWVDKNPRLGRLLFENYKNVLLYDLQEHINPHYLAGWQEVKRQAGNSWQQISSWFAGEIKEALAPPERGVTLSLPVKGRPQFLLDHDESGRQRLGLLIPQGTEVFSAAAGVVREAEACAGGWRILLDHSGEWSTVYYPVLVPYVVQGQWVNGKEMIGRAGLSSDQQRHRAVFFWEVRHKDLSVNPIEVAGPGGIN
ncbi:MAG TPA: M23 family metallopeptidase [Firmicutes bacterium]|nr:M23 family metallopeptidase [Bacillota bacterium]